jgi:NAD(P)-dependent dehydrogenase (short-subunit alcohol dehydrogenase family)
VSRVALVTGANAGIGLAIAERLQREGFALVYATRRRDDKSERFYERLSASGDVHWAVGDLSDAKVPEHLVGEARAAYGRLDALVNNAGLTSAKPGLELTAEDFDSIFSVDVRAAFLLSKEAAPLLKEQGGSIVNITSVHEHIPKSGAAAYCASKGGLGLLTKVMALELAEHGIRVNAIAPGEISTPMTGQHEEDPREQDREGAIPLERPGHAYEIGRWVAFLASPDASYASGASFVVDGGLMLMAAEMG